MKPLPELTKLYYTISEAAAMFDVSTSLLRYWETEFPTLRPKKDRRGDRKFQKKDIFELEKIYILVKERGFTLEGAKKELKSSQSMQDVSGDLKKQLIALKSKIERLKNSLE